MDIVEATKAYELWLGGRIPTIRKDLREKHAQMATKAFAFLRATFYRWAQTWREICPDLVNAPEVPGVGDLHIENFGTWRDVEGRLIWGVNDFDEGTMLPYTNDLVRLATSAELRKRKIPCSREAICRSVLEGYTDSLKKKGRPYVVGKEYGWLRDLARRKKGGDPRLYWVKLEDHRDIRRETPPEISTALERALPERGLEVKLIHRQGGLGSLGRRRYTALTQWREAAIAREAKELTASAWHWEMKDAESHIYYKEIVENAVRVPDPFLRLKGNWVIRRLAPDCSKLELGRKLNPKIARELLYAMGWETANIHLGDKQARRAVLRNLQKRDARWLDQAVKRMAVSVRNDWRAWRTHYF